ncbi:hypothetical protein [Luteibacter aegosomatissinici]|uniref:hypothetical protein n=1 Tax=Luteibacter aegosomatissinici TaxID=2911539 RepID=UPI001FF81A5A|nr:hypothetical protein [Luteibacter aegosomatissinici]UPG92817.1 hypothetical protein L2Y97_13175 [Luteibacter aegosomatissinici]
MVAIRPRQNGEGVDIEPTYYFLCWNGVACSPHLHINPLAAIDELLSVERAEAYKTAHHRAVISNLERWYPAASAVLQAWTTMATVDWSNKPTVASTTARACSVDTDAAMDLVGIDADEVAEFRRELPGARPPEVAGSDLPDEVAVRLGIPKSAAHPTPARRRVRL